MYILPVFTGRVHGPSTRTVNTDVVLDTRVCEPSSPAPAHTTCEHGLCWRTVLKKHWNLRLQTQHLTTSEVQLVQWSV